MSWRQALVGAAAIVSPLAIGPDADAQPSFQPQPVWFDASARQLTPLLDPNKTSSCGLSACTLYLANPAGVFMNDTVSGSWLVNGASKGTAIQDKMVVTDVSGEIITLKPSDGSQIEPPAQNNPITLPTPPTMFIKNVMEFGCLFNFVPETMYCGNAGLSLSTTAFGNIGMIQVTDAVLNGQTALDASFPSGLDPVTGKMSGQIGFNSLLN